MKTKTFIAYAREVAELKKTQGRISTSRNFTTAINRLESYFDSAGSKHLTFAQIDNKVIILFEEWLKLQGICRNTSACYLRSLTTIWFKAVREGITHANPFLGTYRGIAKTRKRAIKYEDILRLRKLDIIKSLKASSRNITGKQGAQHIRNLQLARDIFLFSFCARGISFVDLAYLTRQNINDGFLCYYRRKTGQRIEIRIEKPMQEILNRMPSSSPYLFPIINETCNPAVIYQQYRNGITHYNKYLKELGHMLGVPLTSYVCRHTWATIARRNQLPVSLISQALGHQSERTTEIYLSTIDTGAVDDANRTLIKELFKE